MKLASWKFTALLAIAVVLGFAAPAVAEELPSEASLIAVLQSDADWGEKQAACRYLRRIGTEESIPALVALLPQQPPPWRATSAYPDFTTSCTRSFSIGFSIS